MAVMLSDLFAQEGVKCPDFLKAEMIMTELLDSNYSFENKTHTWKFKDEYRDIKITFDNETYIYQGFDEDGNEIYRKEINKEDGFIT